MTESSALKTRLRIGLFAGLIPRNGGTRAGDFFGHGGRERLLSLRLQGFQLGIDTVSAELRELGLEIVVLTGGRELVEGFGGGFFLRHGLLEAIELRERVI